MERMTSFEKMSYNLCVLHIFKEKNIFLTSIKFKDTKTLRNKDKRKLKEKLEALKFISC